MQMRATYLLLLIGGGRQLGQQSAEIAGLSWRQGHSKHPEPSNSPEPPGSRDQALE